MGMGIISSLLSCAASPSVDVSKEETQINDQTFHAQEQDGQPHSSADEEPSGIALLRRAYPDVTFTVSYDAAAADWKLGIETGTRSGVLYWCDGKLLPEDALEKSDSYWPLMYTYSKEIPDPADFTQEDVERIRAFSSPENRRNGASSPQFFYDLLYDCESRQSLENHIIQVSFLDKKTNIHERLRAPLAKVEAEITAAAKTDGEIKDFIDTLARADSYNWREIRDSGNRSFHSMGIAIDVLPQGWGRKNLYWAWRRDIDPENWMLLPLDRRWMPPLKVIEIFENNGFIWGGKWTIWDNMHFEYRPEVILYSFGDEYNGGA